MKKLETYLDLPMFLPYSRLTESPPVVFRFIFSVWRQAFEDNTADTCFGRRRIGRLRTYFTHALELIYHVSDASIMTANTTLQPFITLPTHNKRTNGGSMDILRFFHCLECSIPTVI